MMAMQQLQQQQQQKQRIVIEMEMRSRKRRAKVMKIAAVADGVTSVAFDKENRDQIVVIGDGVDPVGLVLCLRKKVGHANLVNVEELVEQAE